MTAHTEDIRTSTGSPEPAAAPDEPQEPELQEAEPQEAAAAESDHSDCPYCGETSRHAPRRYRFCGHGAATPALTPLDED